MSISNVNNSQVAQDVNAITPQGEVGQVAEGSQQLGQLKPPSRWAMLGRIALSGLKSLNLSVVSALTLGMNFIVPDMIKIVKEIRAGKAKGETQESNTLIEMQDFSESEKKKKASSKESSSLKSQEVSKPKEKEAQREIEMVELESKEVQENQEISEAVLEDKDRV